MKLKLTFFSLCLLLCLSDFVNGQTRSDEEIVKSIAKQILDNTTRDFVVPGTGQILTSVDERNYQPTVKIRSPYNTWSYWNGVLNLAMLDMFQYFGDSAYRDFSVKNYEFVYKNIAVFQSKYKPSMDKWSYPFGQFIVTRELDDCGAMGGGLIEVYRLTGNENYRPYIDKAASHILNGQERLDDGTLVRSGPQRFTLWADDLYMSIVFLARMGNLTGDPKYFDDAARQVINFTKYLYNLKTGLYYHGWYSDIRQNNVAHWGRCNGWVMLAQTELLRYLPANHPQRDTLLAILQQQVIGVSRYQSQTGLWHQLIDKSDSYLETSCTAMFTYSIAKAVNNGWLDKRYASIAVQGWKGLKTKVQSDGQVQDICIGTGMEDNLVFYYDRPRQLNDIHGLGAVLMAGLEMLKMK
jgi:rhamnogalacturonyl hydrolase YesR